MIRIERRFVFEYVDAGAGDLAAVEGVCQGLGVDDGAAGFVDQEGRRLHVRQRFGVDHAAGLYDIGLFHQFLQGNVFDELRIGLMGEAVVGDDLGAEGVDELGDAVADGARADEADSLAFQFSADEAGLRAGLSNSPKRC